MALELNIHIIGKRQTTCELINYAPRTWKSLKTWIWHIITSLREVNVDVAPRAGRLLSAPVWAFVVLAWPLFPFMPKIQLNSLSLVLGGPSPEQQEGDPHL